MKGNDSRPLLVLAFDALDFRYLDAFSASLPTLSSLRAEGTETPLRSTFPPVTGSAWPSMYTGMNPGHHGVFGFFRYDDYPDTARVVTRNEVRAPAIWNYLSALDIPSIVLNMPVTYPAEEITGVIVPGDMAPSDASASPGSVRSELDETVGEYRIYPDDTRDIPERFVDLVDLRERAARHLLTEKQWGLAVIQVQVTDTVFHKTDSEAAHRAVYERVDQMAGTLLDLLPEEGNVVVCSDHGMGPIDGYRTYINEVLQNHGYVRNTSEPTGPSMREQEYALRGDTDPNANGNSLATAVFSGGATALRRAGVSPADVYALLQRVGLDGAVKRFLPESVLQDTAMGVDWRASKAYCGTSSEYGIRLNLCGREPNGVVDEADYEEVRQEVIDLLTGLRTPDGTPSFDFVERREEMYDGPFVDEAPDILFMPTDTNHDVSTQLVGREFVSVDAFNHRPEGVFIGAGPLFERSGRFGSLSLTDVAPVIMALLGAPVPERMTGSVPEGPLDCQVTTDEYPDVTFGTSESHAESDEVRDRLEDLGYL